MRVSEIFFGGFGFTFLVIVWVFGFFAFDNLILKDHFKKKLRKWFKVE